MFQTKEQENTSGQKGNEIEINNLPQKDFKTLVIRMLRLRKEKKYGENFRKYFKT